MCVSQNEGDRLRDGGCLVKGEISALRAPVPRQNAHRCLCQITNRNQTRFTRAGRLSLQRSRGRLWRSDEGVDEVGSWQKKKGIKN